MITVVFIIFVFCFLFCIYKQLKEWSEDDEAKMEMYSFLHEKGGLRDGKL